MSDVPHNLDYSFRAGIFMGDYNAVAYPNVPAGSKGRGDDDDDDDDNGNGGKGKRDAVGFWTDSRNGRGSGGPTSNQPGRNPACEQADVWSTSSTRSATTSPEAARSTTSSSL